jgi:hypothetical protein
VTDKTHAEIIRQAQEYIDEQDRKYGGPPPPLTPEELDASETELHYFLLRGRPKKDEAPG